jgi:hypothetical protein
MAKKGKTDKGPSAAADRSSNVLIDGTSRIAMHDVARRAYELYLARDREDGHDLDDWLQAERELLQAEVDRQ